MKLTNPLNNNLHQKIEKNSKWGIVLVIGLFLSLVGCMPISPSYFPTITPEHSSSLTSTKTPTAVPSLVQASVSTGYPTPIATTTLTSTPIPKPTVAPEPATPPMDRLVAYAFDAARGELVAFGGLGDPGKCNPCGETWVWKDGTWFKRDPVHSPSARTGAAMVYDAAQGLVVLFGGASAMTDTSENYQYTENNDTWLWDGSDWTEQQPKLAPPSREQAAITYDSARHRVVLFGGVREIENQKDLDFLYDTWTWDGKTWLEQPLGQLKNGAIPQPSMAYDAAHQLVTLWQYATGLWTWDGKTWQNQASKIEPYLYQTRKIGYDEARKQIVLLGKSEAGTVETWTWDADSWTRTTTGSGGLVDLLDDATMVYDNARGVLLYITSQGGKFGPSQLRIWAWTGDAWVDVTDHPANLLIQNHFVEYPLILLNYYIERSHLHKAPLNLFLSSFLVFD